MTVEQIKLFLKESVEKNVKWERINLLGGEPRLLSRPIRDISAAS